MVAVLNHNLLSTLLRRRRSERTDGVSTNPLKCFITYTRPLGCSGGLNPWEYTGFIECFRVLEIEASIIDIFDKASFQLFKSSADSFDLRLWILLRVNERGVSRQD